MTQPPKEKDQLANEQPPTYGEISGRPLGVIPSTQDSVLDASKDTLNVLKKAAKVVAVPLLKEVLGLGVRIMQVCQVRCLILSAEYEH
jgi:hypothetical protein